MRIGTVTPVMNEEDLIGGCLGLLEEADERVVVISDYSYQGNKVKHDKSAKIAESMGVKVIRTKESNQWLNRNIGLSYLEDMGVDYSILVDADEYYPNGLITKYKEFIEQNPANSYITKFITLFRRPNWVVKHPDDRGGCRILKSSLRLNEENGISRWIEPTKHIPIELGQAYHLSYVRTPEKIKEKIKNFGHAHEIIPSWYEEKFLPAAVGMTHVHPTAPSVWDKIEEIELPTEIKKAISEKLWSV